MKYFIAVRFISRDGRGHDCRCLSEEKQMEAAEPSGQNRSTWPTVLDSNPDSLPITSRPHSFEAALFPFLARRAIPVCSTPRCTRQ